MGYSANHRLFSIASRVLPFRVLSVFRVLPLVVPLMRADLKQEIRALISFSARLISSSGMNVASFVGIVENGQIMLLENLHVSERSRVYAVMLGQPAGARWNSPHLTHLPAAQDFKKTFVPNANL